MAYRAHRSRPRISRTYKGSNKRLKTKIKKTKVEHVIADLKEDVTTFMQVMEKTIDILNRLGRQQFGVPPFTNYLDQWYVTLLSVMSDFNTNSAITLDDQFLGESELVFSQVEAVLHERKLQEKAVFDATQALSELQRLLSEIEREYISRLQELLSKEEEKTRSLQIRVEECVQELKDIRKIKTGFFRGVSKEEKIEKELEAVQRLNSAEKAYEQATQYIKTKKNKLDEDYSSRKQELIRQIEEKQKKIQQIEIDQEDDTVDLRREVTQTLKNAMQSLQKRNG